MNAKIQAAIKLIREQGAEVKPRLHNGEEWFEIDRRKILVKAAGTENISYGPRGLAKAKEMEELADGVYSLEELFKELWLRRRADEERSGV